MSNMTWACMNVNSYALSHRSETGKTGSAPQVVVAAMARQLLAVVASAPTHQTPNGHGPGPKWCPLKHQRVSSSNPNGSSILSDGFSKRMCILGQNSPRQRLRLAGRAPHGSLFIAVLDLWYLPLCSRRIPESNPRCSEVERCPVNSCLPPGEGGDD